MSNEHEEARVRLGGFIALLRQRVEVARPHGDLMMGVIVRRSVDGVEKIFNSWSLDNFLNDLELALNVRAEYAERQDVVYIGDLDEEHQKAWLEKINDPEDKQP